MRRPEGTQRIRHDGLFAPGRMHRLARQVGQGQVRAGADVPRAVHPAPLESPQDHVHHVANIREVAGHGRVASDDERRVGIQCAHHERRIEDGGHDGVGDGGDLMCGLHSRITHPVPVFKKVLEAQRTDIDVLVDGHSEDGTPLAHEPIRVVRPATEEADAMVTVHGGRVPG